MNENDFFREATLRICGDLDIGQAMASFLRYVQDFIPVDRLLLLYYDKNEEAARFIADATPEKGESVDRITPISEEAKDYLKEKYGKGVPEPYYYENPFDFPTARELLNYYKQKAKSILIIPLGIFKLHVGAAAFISVDSQYNEKHLKLASFLKEPFQIAMTNRLKHSNELRLFNRDFFFEVTQRICGHLEIEEGLRACIRYISQYIPADRIYLIERHDGNSGEIKLIARAGTKKGETFDMLLTLPEDTKKAIAKKMQTFEVGKLPEVFVFNAPHENQIPRSFLKAINEQASSVMWLPLVVEGQVNGSLILLAKGTNRFNDNHIRLFSTLKKPFFIAISNAIRYEEVVKLKNLLVDDNRYLQGELKSISGDTIIGANFGLKEIINKANKAASVDSPVILLGETGVGKDVIANAIHYSSSRKDGPFIKVNCGAIPDTLIDSELFGHEKGAFTGAISEKRGRFERADKGTIFLDEIGELPLQAQVRLLRVLQEKEIERVGGTKTISLNIRIIAASNCNLEEMVKNKKFREDLWFRINVFPIKIPPLRDRKIDIPALIQHFINLKAKELKLPIIPEVKPGVIEKLKKYHWPGNIRELQNLVERELIINPTSQLTFESLNLPRQDTPDKSTHTISKSDNLDELVLNHIQAVLSKTNGKIHGKGGAAELLGINASTLRNRMNKLGIKYLKKA